MLIQKINCYFSMLITDNNFTKELERIDNINGWRESGGIGIHHVSAKHTIDQLKVLGL